MLRGDIKGSRDFKIKVKERKLYSKLFQEFYRSMEIKGRSEETLKTYIYHNRYFTKFLKLNYGDEVFCNEINLETFEDYVRYLQHDKGIKNNTTINSYMQNVSPVIKFGVRNGDIVEDFYIPYLKVQETFKEIYSAEELDSLLIKPKKKDFVEIRTWAIIWTFASTGVRATELRNLKVGAVDLLNRSIVVNHTKNKKARYLPISNALAEVLEKYMELRKGEKDDYLFCTVFNEMLQRSSLQKGIKNYCNARGVEKCSLHLFRHTFITNAVNTNVSPLILKKITGHSTMKELNRYYNATLGDIVGVIDEVAPKINKKESYFKKKR